MRTLKSRLPGLNALLTFEAAARTLSFTRAADELCVSLAAVSAQIRRLEERLGTSLFMRKHRAVELTESGRRLQEAVTMGFEGIAGVVAGIAQTSPANSIQIATTVAFATYWFAPRLNAFRHQHPDVEVRVLASDRQQDLLSDAVDIALTCGWAERPGWIATRLFSEVVFPVCAPVYVAKRPIDSVGELRDHTLLHLDDRHWEDVGWDAVDWTLWLSRFGVTYQPRHPIVSFNNYPMLVEAALAGEGVALGWRHLSESLLAQGRLVRPLVEECDFQRNYYLALRDRPNGTAALADLHEWLLEGREGEGVG
jgi:DNA-binding transcriptional LysR family regulator